MFCSAVGARFTFGFVSRALEYMIVFSEEDYVKLLTKFNLVLVLVFGLGMFLISHYAYNFLMSDAREQVLAAGRANGGQRQRHEGLYRAEGESHS